MSGDNSLSFVTHVIVVSFYDAVLMRVIFTIINVKNLRFPFLYLETVHLKLLSRKLVERRAVTWEIVSSTPAGPTLRVLK